jgi:hypothetical protein
MLARGVAGGLEMLRADGELGKEGLELAVEGDSDLVEGRLEVERSRGCG